MTYFNKRYHSPGTPPGTLVEEREAGRFTLRLIDYTDVDYVEKELATADECKPYLSQPTTTWVHMQGQAQADVVKGIGELFGLHALAMEDVLNIGQRPKIEEYEEHLFIVMSMPVAYCEGCVSMVQISLFMGRGYIVSFAHGASDPFEPIRKRLRKRSGRIRARQQDYLLYAVLDLIVDQSFPILESFGEKIEILEDEVLTTPTKTTLEHIHVLRRELLLLRRFLWPQREVLNYLLRGEHPLVREDTLMYLRDCYDHNIQIMDLIENYRDMAASMLDVYLSSVSHHLNEIMRVLTMIATIFIPLTFIVGIYGMNFGGGSDSVWAMPELRWTYGYPMVWGIMIAVVAGMLLYFKRKDWF